MCILLRAIVWKLCAFVKFEQVACLAPGGSVPPARMRPSSGAQRRRPRLAGPPEDIICTGDLFEIPRVVALELGAHHVHVFD
eukprot:3283300-Amphidinium_carterae.1